VLRGVLMLGLITLGVVAVVWCVFNGPRLVAWAVAAARLLRILPPPPPTPLGMPIERISADLRRIRAKALSPVEVTQTCLDRIASDLQQKYELHPVKAGRRDIEARVWSLVHDHTTLAASLSREGGVLKGEVEAFLRSVRAA